MPPACSAGKGLNLCPNHVLVHEEQRNPSSVRGTVKRERWEVRGGLTGRGKPGAGS